VLVSPEPNPGTPHEHTLRNARERTAALPRSMVHVSLDHRLGLDPAIRDRDTGIWQKVYLSTTGPVLLKDPLVTTDLPLPKTDSTDVAISTTVENVSDQPVEGVIEGTIGDIAFQRPVDLAPHSTQRIGFDSKSVPALHIVDPACGGQTAMDRRISTACTSASRSAKSSQTNRTSASACARLLTACPAPTT